MAKGKSRQEVFYTKGGVAVPTEGFANGITGTPPDLAPYGPHKEIGSEPFPHQRVEGAWRSPLATIMNQKKGKGKK